MSIVDRKIVLVLNGNWQALRVTTVAEAFTGMMGGNSEIAPVQALNMNYALNENGEYNFDEMPDIQPVSWLDWMALPIREYDLVVNTSKAKIRVPSVIVAVNYKKIPKRKIKPTARVLHEIQKGICAYSGEKISLKQGSLEHVTPRSHGGKDTFENLIYVKREINHKRGNRPLEECGLKPLFRHKTPAPIPVNYTIKDLIHPDWKWFVG